MAKDEVSKQFEELEKRIKEQEKKERRNGAAGFPSGLPADKHVEKEDKKAVENLLPEKKGVSGDKKKEIGNEKIEKIYEPRLKLTILLLLILLPASLVSFHDVAWYKKITGFVSKYFLAGKDKSSMSISKAAVAVFPKKKEKYVDTASSKSDIVVLYVQKEEIERQLELYRRSEYKYLADVPENVRNKRFLSLEEKETFFAAYYESLKSVAGEADSGELESAKFFLDYVKLEIEYERLTEKFGMRLKESFGDDDISPQNS